MKVSASVFAVRDNYERYAKELQMANVDFLHIDIFQDRGEFRIRDLQNFRDVQIPMDVHLIYQEISEDDIELLNGVGVRYLNVQYEKLKDKEKIIELSRKFNGNFGIAITAETSIDVIEKYINYISQVLFMCSEPGVSGAAFNESNYERIEKVHEKYPTLALYADGGIDNKVAKRMEKLGVSLIVSGSYLSRDIESLNSKLYQLKYLDESKISVRRRMVGLNSLPLINSEASFTEIINMMNEYRMGMVFVVEAGVLKGIIGDGDVRRGFLKFKEHIFSKKAGELMNESPLTITSEKTMKELLERISNVRKGVDVIPVIDNGMIIGAIDLKLGI